MRFIEAYSADDALYKGVQLLNSEGQEWPSRNGPMIEIREPVTTTYRVPGRYVMFSPARDCNPFFHIFEAVWMLAGSNRVKPLANIVPRMESFSDNGNTLRGAYGHRWRNWFDGRDRLEEILEQLSVNPLSRRAYLPMWDPHADDVPDSPKKDEPCNVGINFRLRRGRLHMTVFNRSNDMLWGAYGANLVHFSLLQEYMAARLARSGVGEHGEVQSSSMSIEDLPGLRGQKVLPGLYHQVSDSLHVYPEHEVTRRVLGAGHTLPDYRYFHINLKHRYITELDIELGFDRDLELFNSLLEQDVDPRLYKDPSLEFECPWFQEVLLPLWRAWVFTRGGDYDNALREVRLDGHDAPMIDAEDWATAMQEWILRRKAARKTKA